MMLFQRRLLLDADSVVGGLQGPADPRKLGIGALQPQKRLEEVETVGLFLEPPDRL